MKLIDDLRRENLARLRDSFNGVKPFADHLGKSESQVSQWINGSAHSETGKPRGMRSSTARWIEDKCGKRPGWLDQDHSVEALALQAGMRRQLMDDPSGMGPRDEEIEGLLPSSNTLPSSPSDSSGSTPEHETFSDEERFIAMAYRSASPEMRAAIMTMAKTVHPDGIFSERAA